MVFGRIVKIKALCARRRGIEWWGEKGVDGSAQAGKGMANCHRLAKIVDT